MDKRGQGEQFNWLFVLIAGAIILSFFTIFTFKYIGIQQQRQNAQLGRTLGENIHLLEASGTKSYYIDDSQFKLGVTTDLAFTCTDDRFTLSVNKNFQQKIQNEVVFAAAHTSLSSLDAWIYSWDYPYFIVNMIYLADPHNTYYFIYDSGSKQFVQDLDFPEIFTTTKQDKNLPILAKGSKKATIIYFTHPTKRDIQQLHTTFEEASVLSVNTQQEEVTFYDEKGETTGTVPYYGDALLYGAIFSNSLENYQCSIKRSLQRFKRITTLYANKALLLNQATTNPACSYTTLHQQLLHYATTFEHERNTETLTHANEELGGKGCPTVF